MLVVVLVMPEQAVDLVYNKLRYVMMVNHDIRQSRSPGSHSLVSRNGISLGKIPGLFMGTLK